MSELPDGWAPVPLGMVGSWGSGGTPTRTNEQYYAKDGIPWLVIGDLNDRVVLKSSNFITELGLANSSAKLVPAGALLVAMYGSIGKLGIAGIECATNQAIAFCKPNESIVSLRYLYHAMFNAKADLLALGQGGAQQNISQSVLKEFQIPLAPKNEQTRIANQLDTLLARVQACNDRFDAIPALLKRFRQTVLDAATSGRLTEDWRRLDDLDQGKWKAVALQDVITEMRNGLAQKPNESPPGYKILRIGAVRSGQLNLNDHRYLVVSDKEAEQYALKKDDILFTRYNGSLEFVGVCAALTHDAPGYVYPDKLIRVRVHADRVIARFIEIVFGCRIMRAQVESFVKSSAGQRGVSGADLKAAKFFLPPIAEQTEIVRRVAALFKLADRIEARCISARTKAQRLTPLVLAKAFRGELVPQDASDEPASALLARITEQRAAPAGKSQTKKPRQSRLPRASKETSAMTKSRQDEDVKDKPYLADHLRRLGSATTAEVLFKASELPVADFYKQLAWEVAQGYIADGGNTLEARHAAG